VEGQSGILAVAPPWFRPVYEFFKRRLTWPNGAIATTFSAEEPERLRGPQHDSAVCDELGSWSRLETWDMLQFGLRLRSNPPVWSRQP
jgi:phage terminase large subunit-like protein